MELILTERGLPELLHYEDRNSMAHSLEARVPFLDYRLVELCFSLPPSLLIDRGVTKVALRRALADLMPPLVRDRIDKLGFVTPEGRWMRQGLGRLAADVFASKAFADRGFIDPKAAQKRLEAHRSGKLDAGFELWRVLNLELWARTFLDAQPTPSREPVAPVRLTRLRDQNHTPTRPSAAAAAISVLPPSELHHCEARGPQQS